MKFDIVLPDQGEEALSPRARLPEGAPGWGKESASAHPGLRIQRSSEYMRLRARTDLTRVRSALNQMLHTVEAISAGPAPVTNADSVVTGSFHPEAFRSRTAPEPPREQWQEDSP
ncbi:hypothetical protein CQJ94_02430 [Glycomyces fuscus]|nr:hypothetical protein CQJ94_02430 [Glycomyces fuscus]